MPVNIQNHRNSIKFSFSSFDVLTKFNMILMRHISNFEEYKHTHSNIFYRPIISFSHTKGNQLILAWRTVILLRCIFNVFWDVILKGNLIREMNLLLLLYTSFLQIVQERNVIYFHTRKKKRKRQLMPQRTCTRHSYLVFRALKRKFFFHYNNFRL